MAERKSFQVQFPRADHTPVVETPMMREVASRTLAVHSGGALVVWSGRHRLGKTTTARWLVEQINAHDRAHREDESADPDVLPFRAVHYEVGQIPRWSGHAEKKAIRSLYHALVGPLDEGLYRRLPVEDIARQLLHAVRKREIGMVFVDEAGKLSMDAIDGMVAVRDVAEDNGYPLSLVFIGMGDLPAKIEQRPRISSRVHEWCTFREYSFEDTRELLVQLHPHFAALDPENNADHRDQIAFVHQTIGGIPGEIVPFLRKLDAKASLRGGTIDLTLLKAVHLITNQDREQAVLMSGLSNPATNSKAPIRKKGRHNERP